MKKILALVIAFAMLLTSGLALIANAAVPNCDCEYCPSIVIPGVFQSEVKLYNEDGSVKLNEDGEIEAYINRPALENGNEEYTEIWRYFREISLREYMKTYKVLGIDFDYYTGESFFTDKMPAIVEELKEKNMLKLDDGASVVDLSDYNMPPCLILRRDGSTLYPTRDIAAAKWRKQEYDFDKCVYVTSAGQSLHFAQWFKVVELMGYDWAKGLVHVPYGTMSFGGEKLASRTGNIIYLDDLLAQAIEKAEKIIAAREAAREAAKPASKTEKQKSKNEK